MRCKRCGKFRNNPEEHMTILYAQELERKPIGRKDIVLWGFYPSIFVSRLTAEKNKIIYQVEVSPFVGTEDQALYWAWWDNKDKEFAHVYYCKQMVQMCFPYELSHYEKKGKGKLTPVEVKIIKTILPTDPDERAK